MSDDLDLLRHTPIVTGRYSKFRLGDGVAIRTTVGSPRFWRTAQNGALITASEIAPYGVFRNPRYTDLSAKKLAYLARLEANADQIVWRLASIARAKPDKPLVLLCFENVHAGEECHRRWFADWFQSRYGIAVPELDPDPPELTP